MGALSMKQQRARMKALWPGFAERRIDFEQKSVRWVGQCRPQFMPYTLDVRYQLGGFPAVRVLKPALVRLPGNAEGSLPHVYPPADDPTLCLFDPAENQWNSSMFIAETTLPWAYDWIVCYEMWLMTGRWTGGGRHGPARQIGVIS